MSAALYLRVNIVHVKSFNPFILMDHCKRSRVLAFIHSW